MRNWVILLVLVNFFVVYCGAANATRPERPDTPVPTDNEMDHHAQHDDKHNDDNVLDQGNTSWGAVVITVIMVIIIVLALCACAQWGDPCFTTGGYMYRRVRGEGSGQGCNRNVMNGVKIVCGDEHRGNSGGCDTPRGGYPQGCCDNAVYAPRGGYPPGYCDNAVYTQRGCVQQGETQPLVFAVQGVQGGGGW